MQKLPYILFLTALLISMPVSAFAATENDLREVIGMERVEGEKWEKTAATILAQCNEQESYNELLNELEHVKDEETAIIQEQIQEKKEYYVRYMEDFLKGKPTEDLIESMSDYNRMYKLLNQTTIDSKIGGSLEYYDTSTISKQISYANAILALCKSTSDIGQVGQDADTFLMTGLCIQNITDDTLTCRVTPEDKVYAQFNGIVTKITGDTIEIKSGNATSFTYTGVKAKSKLSVGLQIKQYYYIGNAINNSIIVTMQTGTIPVNPLKIYGKKAVHWQETYLRTVPWDEHCLNMDNIKNSVQTDESESSSHSTMIDKNGDQTNITEEPDRQDDMNETVIKDENLEYLSKQNEN